MEEIDDKKYREIISYALKLVAKKRYTKKELFKKIRGKTRSKGIMNKAMKRLEELKYINDEQFIADYTNSILKRSPRGLFAIKQKLKSKGIENNLIDDTFGTLNINELEYAKQYIDRKKGTLTKFPKEKQKSKLYAMLSAKGFNADSIYKAMESW